MRVQDDDHVRLDALRGVACGGEDGGSVRTARSYDLTEPVVRCEHRDGVGQLIRTETDELLDERSPGPQPFPRARLDVVRGAGKHCGQRHSLSDDDQSDDQYEKPFAETTHETDSNARADIVGAERREPRQFDRRNETSRTQKPGICKGNRPEDDLTRQPAGGLPHCGYAGPVVPRGARPRYGHPGGRSRFRSRRSRFDHRAVR